jgi:hypothetical protein
VAFMLITVDLHTHFQNGIAEQNIRDLQDRARTMIIHAKNKGPEAIDTMLWPYAISLSCGIDNSAVQNKFYDSRIEEFANVDV